MHAPLGDHLAVEVGEFLQEPHILQQSRAARAGGLGIVVVDDGRADGVGQFVFRHHGFSSKPFTEQLGGGNNGVVKGRSLIS